MAEPALRSGQSSDATEGLPGVTPAFFRRLDTLLLGVLLLARLRIDTLAEGAVLPLRQQDVARHSFLGHLLSGDAMRLLAEQQLVDPIALLLIVAALAAFVLYWLVAEFVNRERLSYRLKLALIWIIILLSVFAPSLKLVLLRQGSGPASYSHDGGVIQTEATIDYILAGRNPYVEDYVHTPMAEWGINEFRTALYHYPYLPWTFLFSAPLKLLADVSLGWYDQRFAYLLLFVLTLMLLPGLARAREPRDVSSTARHDGVAASQAGFWTPDLASLCLVMLIGLNPLMGSDLIYGQNDSFVLAWLVLSLWLLARGRSGASNSWYLASAAAFGLACASKPTAWFLAPFYVIALAGPTASRTFPGNAGRKRWVNRAVARGWPAVAASLAIIGPYFLWNPGAMIDDVWRWSAGTSPTAYQIWGWGASNLLLAFGGVATRFDYWPFWVPELILGLPLMGVLIWRQWRRNTLARACWSYGLFLLVFFFVSRFLNENYLGYILAFLTLGTLTGSAPDDCTAPITASDHPRRPFPTSARPAEGEW